MHAGEIEQALASEASDPGFWRAVSEVKRRPELVDQFAARIAAADQERFRDWALLVVPATIGTTLALFATVAGLLLGAVTYYVDEPGNGLVLLAGTAVLLVSTHGLGHLVVGKLSGIRFTAWFIGSVGRPQPGIKVDYASYLRAPARSRAWMHASGAIVSKLVPFMMLGPAFVADTPWWTWAALLVVGFGSIVTDALWSVTRSDWKRFRREMALARALEDG